MNNKVLALGVFIVSVSTVTGYVLYSRMKKLKEVVNEEESE